MNIAQALHAAVFTELASALDVAVLDQQPQDGVYPFVTLTDDDDTRSFDTDTSNGADVLFHVHVWSRYEGSAEVRGLLSAIYAALHRAQLTVAGATLVNIEFMHQLIIRDSDGRTRHGVAQYRSILIAEGTT